MKKQKAKSRTAGKTKSTKKLPSKKSAQMLQKKKAQAPKTATRRKPASKKSSAPCRTPARRDIFAGATEISITENKIAVTKKASASKSGRYAQSETRIYHDKTPTNMQALDKFLKTREAKKLTVKF